MKLRIFSDLHIEFPPFELASTDANVVILAGDIGIKTRGSEMGKRHIPLPCDLRMRQSRVLRWPH